MTFNFAEINRITQILDRDGEAALFDFNREMYAAWTEYVEERCVVRGGARPATVGRGTRRRLAALGFLAGTPRTALDSL